MTVLLDTLSALNGRGLALWQDIVCDVFVELDCKSDADNFRGSVVHSDMGRFCLTRVDASRQRVFRTNSRIARAKEDFLIIAFGADGTGGVLQDSRETLIRPGEFAFYDTTRPYELHFDSDFTQNILRIPAKLVRERIGSVDDLTAVTFSRSRPLQGLAVDFVNRLSEVIDKLDEKTAATLSDQALDLVTMAVGAELGDDARRTTSYRSTLLFRIKAYIQANLSNPNLSLSAVAAEIGISPRYLNMLFESEAGILRAISSRSTTGALSTRSREPRPRATADR